MSSGKQRMADHAYKHRIDGTALFQSSQNGNGHESSRFKVLDHVIWKLPWHVPGLFS
jgi:hypothetical protein